MFHEARQNDMPVNIWHGGVYEEASRSSKVRDLTAAAVRRPYSRLYRARLGPRE